MPAARHPIRFAARITVEIEDYGQAIQAIIEAIKLARPPVLSPAPVLPTSPSPPAYPYVRASAGPPQKREEENRLLDVKQVAAMLGVSVRSVCSYSDTGRMPKPVQIGRSTRWSAIALRQWVEAGCPPAWPQATQGDE
jgi:predicted DNA-binding transcriptional regulator AlpA